MFSMGYVLTKLAARPTHKGTTVPDRIISMSDCLTTFLPGVWMNESCGYSEEERRRRADFFGLDAGRLATVSARSDAALDSGSLIWPSVFASVSDAASFVAQLDDEIDGLWLLGLGADEATRAMLLREFTAPYVHPLVEVVDLLRTGTKVESGGEILGWEILGVDVTGQFHSWLCNDLDDAVLAELGTGPGRFGLIETEPAAVQAMKFIEREDVPREDVPWFVGAISRYPLQSSR